MIKNVSSDDLGLPCKESVCNAEDLALIPGSGRSPEEDNGTPLQCPCLENPRDGGVWWLPSMGSHRVGHDWSDLAVAAAAILNYKNKTISNPAWSCPGWNLSSPNLGLCHLQRGLILPTHIYAHITYSQIISESILTSCSLKLLGGTFSKWTYSAKLLST